MLGQFCVMSSNRSYMSSGNHKLLGSKTSTWSRLCDVLPGVGCVSFCRQWYQVCHVKPYRGGEEICWTHYANQWLLRNNDIGHPLHYPLVRYDPPCGVMRPQGELRFVIWEPAASANCCCYCRLSWVILSSAACTTLVPRIAWSGVQFPLGCSIHTAN